MCWFNVCRSVGRPQEPSETEICDTEIVSLKPVTYPEPPDPQSPFSIPRRNPHRAAHHCIRFIVGNIVSEARFSPNLFYFVLIGTSFAN